MDDNECEHVEDGISYSEPLKYKCKLCGARYRIVGGENGR